MLTTLTIFEINEILSMQCCIPHDILGMHTISVHGKNVVAVRAFLPYGKKVTVVDQKEKTRCYEMTKLAEEGFFEAVIEERSQWFDYIFRLEDWNGLVSEFADPYAFLPTISEYDRYLFGAGNHYGIYKKLGAHLMEINGVKGVAFGVWAPNAKNVSVVGSFNDWDGRRHPMRVLGESGIWELFIPGLCQGDLYKFRIRGADGKVQDKTDPYGCYQQVRPATASIVYDIGTYQWNDEQWTEKRNHTDVYNQPMNIYELHLGSWKRVPEEGNRFLTYRELAYEAVDYCKEMGFSHIELLPVEEHPFDGSWGYQVTGYYAPTSRYGTPSDFQFFVDYCHQNHIGVFLDWVPAHFPKDAHGLARFDGTALYEHGDPKKGEHPDWGTYIFNYGRNEVRNFLIANAIYWIDEFHLDGLRVDAVASMLYLDYGKADGQWIPNKWGGRENLEAVEFLKHMNSVIAGKNPSIMMIGEESTSWPGVTKSASQGGLGFSLKWNMGWMNDFLFYMKKDCIYRKYHQNSITFSLMYAFSENFVLVLSHDEVVHGKGSMIGKMPGDFWQKFANLRVAYGYMYTHPGKKLLFMGDEFGQFSEWSEARSLDWNLLEYPSHKGLLEYVKQLNWFYQKEKALWERDFDYQGFEWISCDDAEKSMVSFIRRGHGERDWLVIVCNFTPETYWDFLIGVPEEGSYEEVFNSDKTIFGGSGVENQKPMKAQTLCWNDRPYCIKIAVPPLGMAVFQKVYED